MGKTTSKSRRRWTAEEKAQIVRRHLRDKVSLADLADETGASPSLISQWVKTLMESAEAIFANELKKVKKVREKELMAKEARIAQLQIERKRAWRKAA